MFILTIKNNKRLWTDQHLGQRLAYNPTFPDCFSFIIIGLWPLNSTGWGEGEGAPLVPLHHMTNVPAVAVISRRDVKQHLVRKLFSNKHKNAPTVRNQPCRNIPFIIVLRVNTFYFCCESEIINCTIYDAAALV